MDKKATDLLNRARAQERRGNLEGAAEGYLQANAPAEACRVLAELGRFVQAAEILLHTIGYVRRKTLNLDPEQRKVAIKAAGYLANGEELTRAVEILLAIGERRRAAEILRRAGDIENAVRLERDSAPLPVVSAPEEPGSAKLREAQQLEQAGDHKAALDRFLELERFADAGRVARLQGSARRAADLFVRAGEPFEAAACYLSMGSQREALGQLVQVPPADPRYREACREAIRISGQLDELEPALEKFLAGFVMSCGPSEDEAVAFYELARLYERHDLPVDAAECYRQLLARRPDYKDGLKRLTALGERSRDRSTGALERMFPSETTPRPDLSALDVAPVNEFTVAPKSVTQRPPTNEFATAPKSVAQRPPTNEFATAPKSVAQRAAIDEWSESPKSFAAKTLTFGGKGSLTPAQQVLPPAEEAPPAEGPLAPGVVVNRRYQLVAKIGQGGMAAVYEATDLELDEKVAIKFFSAAWADEATLGRFKQEVTLSRQFNHRNIVRLYDIGTHADLKYITMELLTGASLGERIRAGRVGFSDGLDALVQACAGLQCVHDAGVTHRDIKPDNFFITSDDVLKVMDFGIAKRHSAARGLTMAGMLAGTPQYMAPEQINNFSSVTHLADLYALGCIAYQMFTGSVPFQHEDLQPLLVMHLTDPPEPPRARNPEIPEELEEAILRLLAKDPAARIQSCRELAALLDDIRRRLPM